jgi:porin
MPSNDTPIDVVIDERIGSWGMSLATTAGGTPAITSGDFGTYVVFEQKLYRVGHDDDRRIGIFGRVSYSPANQNLIDLYAYGGIECCRVQPSLTSY